MQYLYHQDASVELLELTGDEHRYIFKVRRHRAGEKIYLRNLKDGYIYHYLIDSIDKKTATLHLLEKKYLDIKAKRSLHIGWCMIEPKNIEKMLPSLNEIGVAKISFIYCNRSQHSHKLDIDRLHKILLNSSQQSGRSEMMELEIVDSMIEFIKRYPESYMLNFSEHTISNEVDIGTIVVGCEGGFDDRETALYQSDKIVGFDTPMILKSESATISLASQILL